MKLIQTCLFALFMLLSGCSTVPLTGRQQLNLVSDSEILALSNQNYQSYLKGAVRSTNATQKNMVAHCGKKIQQSVENYFRAQGMSNLLNGYNWEFVLVQDKTPNAFCLPGGKVVVYDGILPYTKTETGLAVVLGHEIAHAVAKHSNERISQQMLVQTGGSVLNALLGAKSTTTQNIVSSIYGLGANYGVMLPFSRKQEYEADKLGLIFMAMAGYNPAEAVEFWNRMSNGSTASTPEFMSTHPADANRIKYLRSILPEIKNNYYKK
ncbi:MAG: M48 family metallopeptidase [Bacteroidales bacterium]